MLSYYFTLFLLFQSSFAIIRFSELSVFESELVLSVEIGARIYVASSDYEPALKNINITNDGDQKTALDILKLGNNADGTAVGWECKGTIIISSGNSKEDAAKLSGFLYATTFTQTQDPSFLVYTVNRNIAISHDNTDLTLVFLNQNLLDRSAASPLYVPYMSSRVSDIATLSTTVFSIYWNEPMETYKNPNADYSQQQRIFSNTLQASNELQFANVEPFQIFNEVWYIRSNGRIRFSVEPKWVDPNGSSTTSVTTTGLVMCSYAPENLTINMMTSQNNQASTGLFVLYNLINPIIFTMDGFGFKIDARQEIRNARDGQWVSQSSASFQIQSNVSVAGRYAVQYFQIDGVLLPTIPPTTSIPTSTLQTTTNFGATSDKTKFLSLILFAFLIL